MTRQYRERSILGFSLMVSQAFFYNAMMFTYGLVLLRYYDVPRRVDRRLAPAVVASGIFWVRC